MRHTIPLVAGVPPEVVLATARATLGQLTLSALSSGLGFAGTTGSPAAAMRIRRRLRRCARAIDTALTEAGLTA